MKRYEAAINCAYWWDLKDAARKRSRNHCEFCGRCRQCGYVLHHRHYETVGVETLVDVMLLCSHCHQVIHGWRPPPTQWPVGSLAARGDSGLGVTPLWREYLENPATFLVTDLPHDPFAGIPEKDTRLLNEVLGHLGTGTAKV